MVLATIVWLGTGVGLICSKDKRLLWPGFIVLAGPPAVFLFLGLLAMIAGAVHALYDHERVTLMRIRATVHTAFPSISTDESSSETSSDETISSNV